MTLSCKMGQRIFKMARSHSLSHRQPGQQCGRGLGLLFLVIIDMKRANEEAGTIR
jgi:hypothetical protein